MRKEASWPNLQYYPGIHMDGLCKTIGQFVFRLRLKPCGGEGPFVDQQSAVSFRI